MLFQDQRIVTMNNHIKIKLLSLASILLISSVHATDRLLIVVGLPGKILSNVMPYRFITIVLFALPSFFAQAQESNWKPITGADALHNFVSGITAERKRTGGKVSRAEYHEDSTGVLHEWNASFPRT